MVLCLVSKFYDEVKNGRESRQQKTGEKEIQSCTCKETLYDTYGCNVGPRVGSSVGSCVGPPVGPKVGPNVGVPVGDMVGLIVGDKVGDCTNRRNM